MIHHRLNAESHAWSTIMSFRLYGKICSLRLLKLMTGTTADESRRGPLADVHFLVDGFIFVALNSSRSIHTFRDASREPQLRCQSLPSSSLVADGCVRSFYNREVAVIRSIIKITNVTAHDIPWSVRRCKRPACRGSQPLVHRNAPSLACHT